MWLHLKKIDWLLMLSVLLLLVIGLITLYSIRSNDSVNYFQRQLLFASVGFFLIILISFFDYRILKNYSPILILLYLVALALLIAVLIIGAKTRGVLGWIKLGPINFQPVEFIKLVLVLMLSKYFSTRHIEMYRIRHIIVSGIYVVVPFILISLQPDLGSALILISIWIGIMLVAGIKIRHLIILAFLAIIIFVGSWFWLLKDYQQNRIISFLNPQSDPYGHGYNVVQSLIAVGSGGISGLGMEKATQGQLDFLPEQQADFIFATFAEQWGLIGVAILFIIYGFMFYRMILISINSSNNFARLFVSGVLIMIFIQIIINIGMNMSLLPVIGIPLSLISYGGSNLIVVLISFGIIQSIKVRS